MTETFTFDNLIAGSQKKIVQVPGTVAVGQTFVRGSIAGLLTSTGKWQAIDADNSADCDDVGIAVEALDTGAGETNTTFYVEGEFNENAVTFPGYGDGAADWAAILLDHGIYLRAAVTVAGV